MPQMSSLNWLLLYFYLLVVIYLFNVFLSYFVIKFNKINQFSTLNYENYKWYW